MALLLAVFQKMKLVREKNQLVLEQTSYSSQLSRVQKNIERSQKRYTSLFAQLESKAKTLTNNANVYFNNMMGGYSMNMNNYSGMNGFVANAMMSIFSGNGIAVKEQDGTISYKNLTAGTGEVMLQEFYANGGFAQKEDGTYGDGGYSKEDIQIFNQAKSMAAQMQQQMQMQVQTAQQNYANNVSIWLEAEKAKLQAEQDSCLDALSYEETMLELEKEQRDIRLKRIEQEIQSYDQLVSNEAQNSAPKFGLG